MVRRLAAALDRPKAALVLKGSLYKIAHPEPTVDTVDNVVISARAVRFMGQRMRCLVTLNNRGKNLSSGIPEFCRNANGAVILLMFPV